MRKCQRVAPEEIFKQADASRQLSIGRLNLSRIAAIGQHCIFDLMPDLPTCHFRFCGFPEGSSGSVGGSLP